MTRAEFLRRAFYGLAAACTAAAMPRVCASTSEPAKPARDNGPPYDFWFTRLVYESGDWDCDQRMPSNLADALLQYTTLRVDPQEHVLALSDARVLNAPFCYLTGHKLVEFTPDERENFERYVRNGGFVFVDDCNHDIDGLFAKSFESEMAALFGADALQKLPKDHAIYHSFFDYDGPPATALELNGWGDDLVHEYLKGISINGRLGILYSNKDYGCEWDFDWHNKRFAAEDLSKFGVNIVIYALSA